MISTVLVVCEGNLYRSPIAEALLQAALPACEVRSAGLHAALGVPAPAILKRMFAARGLARPHWAAWQIGQADVLKADLLLAMESVQKCELERRYRAAAGKTFLLGGTHCGEIAVPHRGGTQALERCFQQIESSVPGWVQRINALNGAYAHG